MTSSQRVFINTIAQYVRTLVNMTLTLYTVRLVLNTLGSSDFGIYSLIAGVVTMLSFVTNSFLGTTQRFVSYYQGKGNLEELKIVFNNSLCIHIVLGLLVVLLLEIVFPFLFDGFLNIPFERLRAAQLVYQIVAGIIYVTFITSPYKALLVAHENIVYTSIVEIADAILKIILVVMMTIYSGDKLIFYALSILIVQIFLFICMFVYPSIKYDECILPSLRKINRLYMKQIFGFAGWTVYSAGCYVGQREGIAIVVNKLLGPVTNAAYGIGFQVAGYASVLASAITNAIKPQITKSEGKDDRSRAIWLSCVNSKMVFFLTSMVCIPCVLEIDNLLSFWLGEVPEYSNAFCVMAMTALMADSITSGLSSLNSAIGKIAKYTLYLATPKLIVFPITYLLLANGYNVWTIVWLYVIVEMMVALCRIPYMSKTAGLDAYSFYKNVIKKEFAPFVVTLATCYAITYYIDFEFRFILTGITSFVTLSITIFLFGLTEQEKNIISTISRSVMNKIHRTL